MVDTPAGKPSGTSAEVPAGGPVSERMQALLSRAVEEQVSEQRAVSTVLVELRGQVADLSESVQLAASDAAVERLGDVVGTVVADLRTSTSLLGQRLEALGQRVEQIAADTAAPAEQSAVRLTALSADIRTHGDAVERLHSALESLAAFPAALAAMQQDVAGLHDRLQPLVEVRAAMGDLGSRTATSLEALHPQLEALQVKVEGLTGGLGAEHIRDAVVNALGSRLDGLVQSAGRPIVGPEVLRNGLGDLRASIDSSVATRIDGLGATLVAVEQRLTQLGERISAVGDAAEGVPALTVDLGQVAAQVKGLPGLSEQLDAVGKAVVALREQASGASVATSLTVGFAAVHEDIEHLAQRFTELAPPPVEALSDLVSQRVADRLIETLAPRIADVVLTRVSSTLVAQLADALAPRLKGDAEQVVRAASADSERRILAHVDEAVLALAEALLRRRRTGRPVPVADEAPAADNDTGPTGPPEPDSLMTADTVVPEPAPPRGPDVVATAPAAAADKQVGPDLGSDLPKGPTGGPELAAAPVPVPAPDLAAAPERGSGPTPEAARPAATPGPTLTAAAAATDSTAPISASLAPAEAPQGATGSAAEQGGLRPAVRPKPKVVSTPPAAPKPIAKHARPAARPILDRTPDVPDDNIDPVRSASPRPRQAPRAVPPVPPLTASLPQASADPPKRRPWWRPGA